MEEQQAQVAQSYNTEALKANGVRCYGGVIEEHVLSLSVNALRDRGKALYRHYCMLFSGTLCLKLMA